MCEHIQLPIESHTGRHEPNSILDEELALQFGAYASYKTPHDPVFTDFHGDSPSAEFDRLLTLLLKESTCALDLGCGAGFTLCRVATVAKWVFGVDLHPDLLRAAKARVASHQIQNATFVEGDTTDPSTLTHLPDARFDLAYSRRGPFLTAELVKKLTPNAYFVLELAQDYLGLKSLFGRSPFLPRAVGESDWAVGAQAALEFVPVSVKSYWYEEYFADREHLAAFLRQGAPLHNWWMEPCPYLEERDGDALDLYVRYNTTEKGIRLTGHRKVYLFRRQSVDFYPVVEPGV